MGAQGCQRVAVQRCGQTAALGFSGEPAALSVTTPPVPGPGGASTHTATLSLLEDGAGVPCARLQASVVSGMWLVTEEAERPGL